MKVKGVLIDWGIKENLIAYGCNFGPNENGFDMDLQEEERMQEVFCDRMDELGDLTENYMCGQEDGKEFIFSDDESAIAHIATIYHESLIQEFESDNYDLDYDYYRDL